jgi:hypothetical protein
MKRPAASQEHAGAAMKRPAAVPKVVTLKSESSESICLSCVGLCAFV